MKGMSTASGSKPSRIDPGTAEPRGFSLEPALRHMSPTVTAVLVDAGFYLKRAQALYGSQSPEAVADLLHSTALQHLNEGHVRVARLYRILVYDAPPAPWKGHRPISRTAVDLMKSPTAQWRMEFHEKLRGKRKVALRLGEVPLSQVRWELKESSLKELLNGRRSWNQLGDDDFRLDLRQKGVDMRIGIDIASIAYKRLANQIVLISGDSDFVPAAKLARREGIDVVLDPMWASIRPELFEHIDGLKSVCRKPMETSSIRPRSVVE